MELYIGLILPFAGPFVPNGFLPCDGRVLPVNQYQALYAVIGNTCGGNGPSTFALPDLRGRVVLGMNPMTGSSAILPAGISNYPAG